MKLLIILIIVCIVVSAVQKKNRSVASDNQSVKQPVKQSPAKRPVSDVDDFIKYSFTVEDIEPHRKDILDNLVIENDLYSCTKKELIDDGYIDEEIPKYLPKARPITFEPDADERLKILVDGIHIGYVPEKNVKRVQNMLKKNDPDISWILSNGPYKCIDAEELYYEDKTVYYLNKANDPIDAKIVFRYLRQVKK